MRELTEISEPGLTLHGNICTPGAGDSLGAEKEVFNGDIGRVEALDLEADELALRYDVGRVVYDATEIDEITMAYAITVHKSQGSEYPAVILPLTTQHYVLLQRKLVYTAMIRTKQLVVMLGTKKALGIAVRNDRVQPLHAPRAQAAGVIGSFIPGSPFGDNFDP